MFPVYVCVETNVHPDALPAGNRLPVSVEMTQCIEQNYEEVVDITAERALFEDSEWVCCSADVSSHVSRGKLQLLISQTAHVILVSSRSSPSLPERFVTETCHRLWTRLCSGSRVFSLLSARSPADSLNPICIGSQMNVWCWRLNCCNSEARRGFPTFTNNVSICICLTWHLVTV